jgi:hypothetical protein
LVLVQAKTHHCDQRQNLLNTTMASTFDYMHHQRMTLVYRKESKQEQQQPEAWSENISTMQIQTSHLCHIHGIHHPLSPRPITLETTPSSSIGTHRPPRGQNKG